VVLVLVGVWVVSVWVVVVVVAAGSSSTVVQEVTDKRANAGSRIKIVFILVWC
jgi:hypothetical protein